MSNVFRNPPWRVGSTVFMAHHLADVLDWGLVAQNIDCVRSTSRGRGVLVGVCDTGRPDHIDLSNKIRHSANFSTSASDHDLVGHATHVCGIIAAEENGVGVVGVAPDAELCIAKVLNEQGEGSGLDVAEGIRFCVEKGCHIICMSLGNGQDAEMEKAVLEAFQAGVMLICAAGNDGHIPGRNTVNWPARMRETIAVASYTRSGQVAKHSAYGPEVDFACPGEDILSCWLTNNYRKMTGTSMAAPYFAGITALLLARQFELEKNGVPLTDPVRNVLDLRERAQQFAIDHGPKGHDSAWGWGVVNVRKLLASHDKGECS